MNALTTWLVRFGLALVLLVGQPGWAQEWSRPPADPIIISDAPPAPEGWTKVPGQRLVVHGVPSRHDLLLRLARHGADVLPTLSERLQVPMGSQIHVFVAPTDEQYRSLQPGPPPTWSDATAWPGFGVIYLRDPRIRVATDEPLETVLEHELVHILLGRAFAPEHPPAWLQEGVAQVLAEQAGPEMVQVLANATLQGSFMSLSSLERWFPSDAHRAHVAYAESADFVQYLQVEYGMQVIPDLVHAVREGKTLSGAVRAATGGSLTDIEADWRARWTVSRGISAGILAHLGEIAFGGTAILLIAAGLMRRRRFHQRLREMEEEEAMVDALVAELRARRGYP